MSGLPSQSEAAAAPGAARESVQGFVRESLKEEWRDLHDGAEFLSELEALIKLHLAALAAPGEGTFARHAAEHEEACASCLKLARNLCAGRPRVQEFWWRSGTVDDVVSRLKEDTRLADERDPGWCEAVPSFLTNVIAANDELRALAVDSWFPFALANACAISYRRPELAFMLTQTLLPVKASSESCAPGDSATGHSELLQNTEHGHAVLFILVSLLFRGGISVGESREAVGERAWEWASIFMHALLTSKGFVPAYLGVKKLTVEALHSFWCAAVGLPGGPHATIPPGVIERLVGRLCHRSEVLGLFWHSVSSLDSQQVAETLLTDAAFEQLAARELAGALAAAGQEWGLSWRPPAPLPEEACAALGVPEQEVDLLSLAAEEDGTGDFCEGGGRVVFGQLLPALVALSGGAAATHFPVRLSAVCLTGCVSFLDALHRLRFGDDADESVTKKTKPPPEAVEASKACLLVDQLRLCANLLFDRPVAQDLLRHVGGVRVLLSHCYSDAELPLLREVGIFAVRNATHGCTANQDVARSLLEARSSTGPSSVTFDPVTGELTPAAAESGGL